jgi:beta-lactamase class A
MKELKLFKKLASLALVGLLTLTYGKTPIYASANTILGPEVTNYIHSRGNTVSVGVYDANTGKTYTYNPSKTYYTESVVKMSMLANVLYKKTPITSYENTLLTRMIENSNNSAASTIWRQLGSEQKVQPFFRKVGMTNTIAGTGGWWGRTTTTVSDQLTMMKYFAFHNALLSDSQRAYGLNLMRHVQLDQRWGTSSGIPSGVSVALKNGWVTSNPPSKLYVNSVGYINGQGKNYVIAVLTTNNKSFSYGKDTINKISSLVWNEVPASYPAIGYIDAPANNSTIIGKSIVKGWFLDKNVVSKVEILVDGVLAGQAVYGDTRLDVQKVYPQYNNGKAGFHYSLDTTKFSNGKHTVTVRETSKNGRVTTLSGKTVTVKH